MHCIDSTQLEVKVKKEQNINVLFEHLIKQDIEVVSMRNKVNRLEELFMELLGQDVLQNETNTQVAHES